MPIVYKRAQARQDLINHYIYLVENASVQVADRFLVDVELSLVALATQPLMGAPVAIRSSKLSGMRKWQVKQFDNILIFYVPRPGGISVVRVLRAAQDWWKLLKLKH